MLLKMERCSAAGNLVFSIRPPGYINTRRRPSSKASCTADHCWAKGAGDEHQRNAAGSAEHDSPVRASSISHERDLHLAKARQGADLILVPRVLALIAPLMPPSQPRRSGRGTLRAPAPAASMPSVTSPPQRCAISGSIVSKKVGPGGPRDAGGERLSLQLLGGFVPESSVTRICTQL